MAYKVSYSFNYSCEQTEVLHTFHSTILSKYFAFLESENGLKSIARPLSQKYESLKRSKTMVFCAKMKKI